MLKGYRFLTSFCVICATLYGGAYGAASVRSGTTGRAGSLRTLGAGTTASVKATATSAQPGPSVSGEESDGANTARMAHLTGLGDSKISGKLSLPSAASSQTINELRQAIEQLRSDYEALGNQYDNLSGDVSDVYNTAQVARAAATNNTNTLTVVRSDLNDAKSDIEDLKENGLFNAERVAGTVENVLADKNYATQSQLAVTDAVARGAVQPNQLPQKLNELGVADKDYVDSAVANGMNEDQVSTIVGGAIANTMSNYLTEAQTRSAIRNATENKVDKSYVDTQLVNSVYNRATYDYVDNKVATGMNEGKISNIVGEVLGDSLANYYTKGETTNVIQDAIENKVDKGQFNNAVSDIQGAMGNMATTAYVDNAVANLDLDLDENVVKGIVERYNYMDQDDVNAVVNSRLNNYYTKSGTDAAISNARQGLVDQNYFNNTISNMNNSIYNLAPKSWVTDQINTKIESMGTGLSADEVETMISAKGYKDTQGVKDIVESYGYKTAAEVAAAIAEQMPDIDIRYDSNNNQLKFRNKNGTWRTIDMHGLNGQDGAQVNLRKNGDMIQWQHEGDSAWNDLLSVSDLAGPAGKSVELVVGSYWGHSRALGWKQEGQSDSAAQFIASLDDLKGPAGPDGCGVTFSSEDYYENGTKVGTKVIFKRDCPNNPGQNGATLGNIIVRDGAAGEGGDVTEEQILNALEHSNAFAQKADRSQLNDYLKKTDAASTYATQSQFDSLSSTVAGHTNLLSGLDGKTVKQYVDENTPTFRMEKDNTTGKWYICKSGNCTGNPPSGLGWEEFDMNVDLDNYYTKTESNDLFALKTSIGDLGNKTVKQYVDTNIETVNATLADKASQTDMDAVESILSGFGGVNQPQTVKQYVDDAVEGINTGVQVAQDSNGKTYICKTGNNCTTTPPSSEWAEITVDMANYYNKTQSDDRYALKTTVDGHTTDIATLQSNKADKTELNALSSTVTEHTSEIANLQDTKADKNALGAYLTIQNAADTYLTKIDAAAAYAPISTVTVADNAASAADAAQADATAALNKFGDLGDKTVRQYVDDNTPKIQVVKGTNNNNLYICTNTSGCDETNVPGNNDSGWQMLDIAGSIDLTAYLTKTDAADTYLKKTNIELTREGDSIKISGGGIASPYAVASVTDLMCKSYEVERRALTDDRVTYELKCITSDE